MAYDLTLVPTYNTDPITVPQDGDDLDAAVLDAALQLLGDRTDFARSGLLDHLVWSTDFAVASGGSLTAFTISVGAILRLVAADSNGKYWVGNASATTIGVSKVEGAPGTLSATARYWYVYAFITTAGAIDYAISTTAPDSARRYKGGDVTRIYLGCFRTLASGAPLPVRAVGGRYLYQASALGSNELRVVNVATATGATTQSLATLVPPHARIAHLMLSVAGDVNEAALSIFYVGDTAAASARCYAASGGASNQVHVDVPTDATQQVDYSLTGTGSPGGAVHVFGFYE